jgi:hypothetical protein
MCNLGVGLLCRDILSFLCYEWPIQVSAGLQSASLDKFGPLLTWNSHFSTAKVCKTALKKKKQQTTSTWHDPFLTCFDHVLSHPQSSPHQLSLEQWHLALEGPKFGVS